MNAKKWLVSFFFFSTVLMILIELKYQLYPIDRHEVDYLVNKYMPSLTNKEYETVILGDSLAHNAFEGLLLKDNILDITSNQAISMAGNYFLLKRYLEKNKVPKKVFLFSIPNLLYNNLTEIYTYNYFETIFTNKDEKEQMVTIKPDLYKNGFDLNKYFESRKHSIDIGGYTPKQRIRYTNIDEKTLEKLPNFMNEKIQAQIDFLEKNKNIMEDIPKIYLDKILELCKNKNISFTFIIEPIPDEYNTIFKTSKWYGYLVEKNINYVNINDYYRFNTSFFKSDGIHIHGKVNQYYQNLIDTYIVDIY